MAVTKKEFEEWVEEGKELKAKFLISVCDTFDYEDYPVYCMNKKERDKQVKKYSCASMQRINEIIEL